MKSLIRMVVQRMAEHRTVNHGNISVTLGKNVVRGELNTYICNNPTPSKVNKPSQKTTALTVKPLCQKSDTVMMQCCPYCCQIGLFK